jgi:hypothetical protein
MNKAMAMSAAKIAASTIGRIFIVLAISAVSAVSSYRWLSR